jgi:excisionase family DNA binding protein
MTKLLYPTREAKTVLGCGHTTLYDLINKGLLEACKLGHRTYIKAASLEAFVASLPSVVTPTMAKAEHDRWSGHRRPRPKPQEAKPGSAG